MREFPNSRGADEEMQRSEREFLAARRVEVWKSLGSKGVFDASIYIRLAVLVLLGEDDYAR